LKIIAKIFLHCTLLAEDAKIELMLTISQKRLIVSLDELAVFMEPDIKYSMIPWASAGQGRQNGHLLPAWKLGLRTKYFRKKLKSAS